jgi:hypothetical protein
VNGLIPRGFRSCFDQLNMNGNPALNGPVSGRGVKISGFRQFLSQATQAATAPWALLPWRRRAGGVMASIIGLVIGLYDSPYETAVVAAIDVPVIKPEPPRLLDDDFQPGPHQEINLSVIQTPCQAALAALRTTFILVR